MNFFNVLAKTDGNTKCSIFVEPKHKEASFTVTIDNIIVKMSDHNDRCFIDVEWNNSTYWEMKAANIAKSLSPFWRGFRAS